MGKIEFFLRFYWLFLTSQDEHWCPVARLAFCAWRQQRWPVINALLYSGLHVGRAIFSQVYFVGWFWETSGCCVGGRGVGSGGPRTSRQPLLRLTGPWNTCLIPVARACVWGVWSEHTHTLETARPGFGIALLTFLVATAEKNKRTFFFIKGFPSAVSLAASTRVRGCHRPLWTLRPVELGQSPCFWGWSAHSCDSNHVVSRPCENSGNFNPPRIL